MTATFVLNRESKERGLARLVAFVNAWNFDRWPLEIVCERFAMGRTAQQNKALFGLAYKLIRAETGMDVEDLHDFFCRRFFGETTVVMFDREIVRPVRTTTKNEFGKRDVLKWDRFSEFFESVREFAASELGLNIPDPDPDWWKHQHKEAA